MASTKLATANGWIPTSQKGAAGGVASLNDNSVVPGLQMSVRAAGQCLSAITPDDTEEIMYLHAASRVFAFFGAVSARSSDNLKSKAWWVRGAYTLDVPSGGFILDLGSTVEIMGFTEGVEDWTVVPGSVNGGNGYGLVVTGANGVEVHWAATIFEAAAHASLDWAVQDGWS